MMMLVRAYRLPDEKKKNDLEKNKKCHRHQR